MDKVIILTFIIFSNFFGLTLIIVAIKRYKKLEKIHYSITDSEKLLEDEKGYQNKSIILHTLGLLIILVINFIVGALVVLFK